MAIYVAEIKGRGIAAFHADTGPLAELFVRDPAFCDDLMVLASDGLPLWDGMTSILGPPSTRRRGGKMACVACQGDPTRRYRERRPRVDCVPCCTYRSRPKKTAMNEPKALRA